MSEILGPDGMAANKEQIVVKIHEIEIPLPTGDPKQILAACMVNVNTPAGPVTQLGMTPDTALVLLETFLAFEARDEGYQRLVEHMQQQEERIEKLEERIKEMEKGDV